MSHFTVLVVTKNPDTEELEKALQPFHEYECTGIRDEYVRFVDCHDDVIAESEKVVERWKDSKGNKYYPWDERLTDDKGRRREPEELTAMGYIRADQKLSEDYATLEEFAEDWSGCIKGEDGRFGRFTNPDAKWDWWVVGGWWSGKLRTKDGKDVDHGYIKDLDFQTPRDTAGAKALVAWQQAHRVIAGRPVTLWKDLLNEVKAGNITRDEALILYHGQQVVKDLKEAKVERDGNYGYEEYLVERDAYVKQAQDRATATFAFLHKGEWAQRGKMGWWGIVTGEDDGWDSSFRKLLDTLEPDDYIWVVDCHI